MDKITLRARDLMVGKPLPWPVYSLDGALLLSKGYVLQSEIQKSALITNGIYRIPQEEVKPVAVEAENCSSPFRTLEQLKQNLWQTLDNMSYERKGDYQRKIYSYAQKIQTLDARSADAILGGLELDSDSRYTLLHPIMCAVICHLIGQQSGLTTTENTTLIAAAFSQNIGMLRIQEILANQTEALSEQQRQEIDQHPDKGRAMLVKLGITNEAWLDIIKLHHEKPDGSGYPQGLFKQDIPKSVLILSLADIYSAMILPRRYRDGLHVQKALREIFLHRGRIVDQQLAEVFIKVMGVYPPGCFVELGTGEIAIVIARARKTANHPVVNAVIDPKGRIYSQYKIRNTASDERLHIKRIVNRPTYLNIDLEQVWMCN